MWILALAVVTLALSLGSIVHRLVQVPTLRKIRPTAMEISGEVIDNTSTSSGNAGAYYSTPVVRYYVDGKRYEAEIANPVFRRPAAVGTSMTILVSPHHPFSPMDPYGGMGSGMRGKFLVAALGVALLVLGIVRL
ncbi:hypothetical protein [Streptomyces sp. NPDC006739]|uniref:hypothetical protein n=1 Tax=Streptomyces sp. NPDC006739 TaxID=3364763 RepID=UPI003680C326